MIADKLTLAFSFQKRSCYLILLFLFFVLIRKIQPTLWLHDLCLEVLTVHENELLLFMGQGIFPTPIIAAIGTLFKVSSMMRWGPYSNPTPPRQQDDSLKYILPPSNILKESIYLKSYLTIYLCPWLSIARQKVIAIF